MEIKGLTVRMKVRASNHFDAAYEAFRAAGYAPEQFGVRITDCYYYVVGTQVDETQHCTARLEKFNEFTHQYHEVMVATMSLKPERKADVCGLKEYEVILDNRSNII